MATITQRRCRAYKTISGNSPKIIYYPEGVLQTFKKGTQVYLNASGAVKQMVVAGTGTGFDTIRKRIVGIAIADANNRASTSSYTIPVAVDDGDTLFLSNVISRTSAATATLALTQIGKAGTASIAGTYASMTYFNHTASAAASTARCFELIDAVGDTYGRVLWQSLPGARIFG